MRTKIFHAAIILIFAVIVFGLLSLAVIQGRKYRELSSKNCIRLLPQLGSRGRILDRNGNAIVDNVISYDVMIMAPGEEELDKVLRSLSKVSGLDTEELRSRFRQGYSSASMPVDILRNIDISKAIALEELKPDLRGLTVDPHPLRNYPHKSLASHVLGYLGEIDRWRLTKLADYGYKNKDIVGFGGVEERYDYYLRQEDGGLSMEVDRKGRFVRVVGFKSPKSGKDINLTLDLRLQKIVEQCLGNRKGSVVIIDPYGGEILAMASGPDFDPSVFVKRLRPAIRDIINDSDALLYNRAISAAYPAGSLFKLIVSAAALETGKISPKTGFVCNGSISIGKGEFACWQTHGQQNLTDAIAHSCNIFFYRTGLLTGPQPISDYAARFGLGKNTNVDLPNESSGFIPSPMWKKIHKLKNWFDGDTANLSIGQGEVLVTPLQMARVMAVFANKGKLVSPYILKSVQGRDVSSSLKKITTLAFKPSTIDYIRQGLREAVAHPSGTASVLSGLAVAVAGKTGTAQVTGHPPHGWFYGFFPFKEPKFVLCVFLENGGSGYAASLLSREIIEAMVTEGIV